jgi:predicted PurR-regulated permease PerM
MGSKAYRDKVLGGTISYGNAFLAGLLIVIFSSIITGFYTLIFNTIIDPEYMDKVFEATKNWTADYLNSMGLPDSQIDSSIEKIEKQQANYNALKAFFTSIAWSSVFGVVISLITSAFVKKNPNPLA